MSDGHSVFERVLNSPTPPSVLLRQFGDMTSAARLAISNGCTPFERHIAVLICLAAILLKILMPNGYMVSPVSVGCCMIKTNDPESAKETMMTENRLTRRAAIAISMLAAGISFVGTRRARAQTAANGSADRPSTPKPKKIAIILFDRFETLDVFGPIQMWGRLKDYEIVTVSEKGGAVASSQGVETVCRYAFSDAPQFEIIMIPGGGGTRTEVNNPAMLEFLRKQDGGTEWTTSVCTGSAVLAKAGLLDGRKATTNKRAYGWATSQSEAVQWQPRARWVVDGKYVTSSGVSAGTDMALALVEKIYGKPEAVRIAEAAEYNWSSDPNNDPFAISDVNRK